MLWPWIRKYIFYIEKNWLLLFFLAFYHHTLHVIFQPSNKDPEKSTINFAVGALTYQPPLRCVPVPLPVPLYPRCLPWTMILKRCDFDRHINQELFIAPSPVPKRGTVEELQLLFWKWKKVTFLFLSSFLIISWNLFKSASYHISTFSFYSSKKCYKICEAAELCIAESSPSFLLPTPDKWKLVVMFFPVCVRLCWKNVSWTTEIILMIQKEIIGCIG